VAKPTTRGAHAREIQGLRREVESLRGAIALLHRISKLVGAPLDLEPACYAVLTATTAGVGLGLNRAMLFFADPRGKSLHGAGAVGPADATEADRVWRAIEAESPDLETLYERGLAHRERPGKLDQAVRATTLDPGGATPVALAFRRGCTVIGEGEDDAGGLFHLPTAIAAPLGDGPHARGVLYADNRFTGQRLEPALERVFTLVADYAGRAIANAERYERLAGEARTDALTGLGHHGAFMTDLGREAEAAVVAGRPLGMAMIDLDGFKQVNDRFGHLAGDALLAGFAARMRGVVRGGEGVYRYGGDEFAVLIPGATRAAAVKVGNRLLKAIASQPFSLGGGKQIGITCSVGVASLPEDAGGAERLLEAADGALLRAKARGKNVVVGG
jgi:diguanylate cyclase (GGDEF)-like protein